MKLYDLSIRLEELQDGGDYHYLATSPDLPGLLVAGETAEEVLSLAPAVASAMIASLQAEGDPLPPTIHAVSSFPLLTRVDLSGWPGIDFYTESDTIHPRASRSKYV